MNNYNLDFKFTSDSRSDQMVKEYIISILDEFFERYPANNVEAIVLAGGMTRGEGSVRHDAEQDRFLIYSDLDFIIFLKPDVDLLYAQKNDYDVALQLDADGQHKAEEVNKIINALDKDGADMALGSRFKDKNDYHSTFLRRLGNIIFSGLIAMVTKQFFTDSTSGFRAFNRRAINFLAKNYPTDFPEPESLVILKKHDFKISEVAVSMDERQGGQSSVTKFKAVYFMISISIAILIDWIKKPVLKESKYA